MMRRITEQQLPLIEVEEVQPDLYLIPNFWAAAVRLRAARLARIRAGVPVAVPVTPPLSLMGENFTANSVNS